MNFREFFYFQKSDRQVLLVTLAVAVLAFCLIFFLVEVAKVLLFLIATASQVKLSLPHQVQMIPTMPWI